MCLIAFAWGASERFPFVIAANRDEFLERPTAPLSQWLSPGGATVLAGRDLKDGGTWMGFSPNGRFAMLTNVRDPQARQPEKPISRGGLALAWLEGDQSAAQWISHLEPQRYQGFNLIIGDWRSKVCHYITNGTKSLEFHSSYKSFERFFGTESAGGATELIAHKMPWGQVYGLSNASLDTPWPKTQLLKSALQNSLKSSDAEDLMSQNLRALADRSQPADSQLPNTGVPIELERALSSAFVSHPQDTPQYGTRTSLVAVYETGFGLRVKEQTHAQATMAATSVHTHLGWA